MQTRLQLYTPLNAKQKSKPWAIVLFVCYLLTLLFELSMIRIVPEAGGYWRVTQGQVTETSAAIFILAYGVFQLFAALMLLVTLGLDRRSGFLFRDGSALTGTDFLYMVAFVQAFQMTVLLLYGFLPYPLFSEGSIGEIIEGISLHLFILLVTAFWFSGRTRLLGIQWPKRPVLMIVSLIVLFFVITVGVDHLVTGPVSEWLHLSPDSEREAEIKQDVTDAKNSDWLNGWASLIAIGVIVPIAEEILFRGLIQTYLVKRWGAFFGILVSSFWFALIHVDIALFFPLFAIGLILGITRHLFRSLWGSVILHSFNNLGSVLSYLF
ncbi:CPBP family intramembrane glutamic endopeptidase [Brevibacillus fulvus]|uniref:Membrane protease YdiL (CAAX protease family) n=1 Tax=Brevibacillus fulvus TaxID=1125967 RepID=A0A939BQX4_9BACL|nr:type II CAAX endopeptidase family protein [Brevibacillus fulvus]MBM7592080.1 membrane protease YdiL (CAAX protease family) [Brevibacillus fulvus]